MTLINKLALPLIIVGSSFVNSYAQKSQKKFENLFKNKNKSEIPFAQDNLGKLDPTIDLQASPFRKFNEFIIKEGQPNSKTEEIYTLDFIDSTSTPGKHIEYSLSVRKSTTSITKWGNNRETLIKYNDALIRDRYELEFDGTTINGTDLLDHKLTEISNKFNILFISLPKIYYNQKEK